MIIQETEYTPPLLLANGHIHTVYASKFRKNIEPPFQRERWDTPDKDFIDLDFLKNKNSKIVVIGHGLEGHSRRPYITHTADLFYKNGWDVCAWNSRSCSGEMNHAPKLYSHGDTDDLELIVDSLTHDPNYDQIAMVGFSMGGAIILNYLGKLGAGAPEKISAGICISTPLDIAASSRQLEIGINRYYRAYFMDKLKGKIEQKAKQFPELINTEGISEIKKWKEFDDRFSAPLGGFKDAEEFYEYCSAVHRLEAIEKPCLLINSLDDPLLTSESYPQAPFANSDHLHAMYTRKGGHVGFLQKGKKYSFSEERALEFASFASKGIEELFCKQLEKL